MENDVWAIYSHCGSDAGGLRGGGGGIIFSVCVRMFPKACSISINLKMVRAATSNESKG